MFENNIENIFRSSKYPVYIIDNEYRVMFVNEYIEKKFPECINKKCYNVFYGYTKPCEKCIYKRIISERDIVFETLKKDKNILDIDSNCIKNIGIPLKTGRKNGYLVMEFDNTKSYIDYEEKLNELNEINDEFENNKRNENEKDIYYINLAHEIQCSLSSIEEINLKLKKNYPLLKRSELFEDIENLILRSNKSIDKLLRFNKIGGVIDTLDIKEFDLRNLINDIRKRYNQTSKSRNINFSIKIADNIKESYLGDELKISQVIENILDNSFDFTVDGFIKANVYEIEDENSYSTIKISIRDSGIGIPKEQIELIYKRYYKANNKFYRALGKAGLGLSISKEIVESMDGKIEIKSEIGVGTNINIIVKLKKSNNESKTDTINGISDEKKKKVLVIGVDETHNYMLRYKLSSKYEVKKARNGEEGLLVYYKFKPDIVLIDMMSDGLNGFDFYDEIYNNDTYKSLIIATSNKVLESEEDYLMSYGFDAYISKPINYNELEKKIDEMMKDE
jgi:CheY-like chemotaxis protein